MTAIHIRVISDELHPVAAGTLGGLAARAHRTQPGITHIFVVVAQDISTAIDMLEKAIIDEENDPR